MRMNIRPISLGELDAFSAFGRDPEHAAAVRAYVAQMLAKGSMRAEWCFIAEDGGQHLGTLGLWTVPGLAAPSDFVLLEAPWDGDDLAVGDALIGYALEHMRHLGAETAGHMLDTPPIWPQWQTHPERRVELLERRGFTLLRETFRFDWHAHQGLPAAPRRLQFRTLPEVGEAAFLAAIVRVSEGTLDRRIAQERLEKGPEQDARDLFALLAQLGYEPEWWQLAYTPDGILVGLHMPAGTSTAATIGYIGVVPEQRGRGYIDDLLAQITRTLALSNAERIVADTDVGNFPMAEAFRRAGYTQFGRRREYSRRL
jgi:ribosomal protein S18 acetylase RimI-like enzyme